MYRMLFVLMRLSLINIFFKEKGVNKKKQQQQQKKDRKKSHCLVKELKFFIRRI